MTFAERNRFTLTDVLGIIIQSIQYWQKRQFFLNGIYQCTLKVHVAIRLCKYKYTRFFSTEILYHNRAACSKQFLSNSGLSLLNFRTLF